MSRDAYPAQLEPGALPITAGQVIADRYLVGDVLGGGGMGVVCAGTHVLLGTPVAIKLIHSELKDDHEAVGRFVNEARAAARLKGEHIARVFDVGVLPSGEPFLVMEQLEGVALDQYLEGRGALDAAEAIALVLQVCEGLAEAHAEGIVHRDIKPANLFLARRADGQSSLKILDFGIAKQRLASDSPALTNPGKSLGSPWYMSPEQMLTPASVDERADVWSIGVLLFELLTDRVPFDGETVPQVCANVLSTSPPRPSELRAGLAPELEAVVLRCLEKEPERRFASVAELAATLSSFLGGEAGMPLAITAALPSTPAVTPQVPARAAPNYDSLTPLPTSRDSLLPVRRRRGRPLAIALLSVACLFIGSYLQYRDPMLIRRAFSATRLQLPGDPLLLPAAPDLPLSRDWQPPPLLQPAHGARATPEPEVLKDHPPPPRGARARPSPPMPQPGATWGRVTEEHYGL